MDKADDFIDAIRQEGLRVTSQRKLIYNEFLKEKGHINVDEFYRKLRRKNPRVSHTTVYRTLKLLNKYDIAKGVDFGDGTIRYEPEKDHHDHLICTECGSVIEFVCPKLELDQDKITEKFDFLPRRHRLEIFGVCRKCQEARHSGTSTD